MMETHELAHVENMKILMEISKLKKKIGELYKQKGPISSDYITLSIKLNVLMNEYIEEKIGDLNFKENPIGN